MKNSTLGQVKNKISFKGIPETFERFEFVILAVGSISIISLVGFLLYGSIAVITDFQPESSVELPSIEEDLLKSIVQDLEDKEVVYSEKPIVDPFNPLSSATTTIVEE